MKNNTNQIIAIVALVIALIGITVGLATISTNLSINGSATIAKSEWNIHFANLSDPVIQGNAVIETNPSITDTYIGGYYVKLVTPGDSVSYTFDIVNSGTMDASIGTISKSEPTVYSPSSNEEDILIASNNLVYTLTYTGTSTPVKVGDVLNKKDSVNVTLTIGYDKNSTSMTSGVVEISDLSTTLIYIQK